MRWRSVLLLGMISCKQDAPPPVKPPAVVTVTQTIAERPSIEAALALATPGTVSIISFDGGMIVGTGVTFDDVSEFMRALNNIAWCPQGLCRIVERQRSGKFSAEIADGGAVLEYERGELRLYFSNFELKEAGALDGSVHFQLEASFPPH